MRIREQVCSLELAKRLHDLGIKQISLFNWYQKPDGFWVIDECDLHTVQYSAFTVAELGEILPQDTIRTTKWKGSWFVESYNEADCPVGMATQRFTDKSEANAKAKMLIHLIEEGIVKGGNN